MSSERRTVEGSVPDGIADRAHGYTHNPNPPNELAAQQAHFAEREHKYQQERAAAIEAFQEVERAEEERYEEAQHKPEHQAFIAEQREHQRVDPSHTKGGQDWMGDVPPTSAADGRGEVIPIGPSASAPFVMTEVPPGAPLPVDRNEDDRTRE
jgi:hypothetical protein